MERHLSKDQILALFLDTGSLEPGPDGWMTGFFKASVEVYGALPAEVSDEQFVNLIAALIAPSKLTIFPTNQALKQRSRRIEKHLNGNCAPIGNSDVWFEQCA
ncbi:MAG: transglycosylase domain-containing protein [Granulosicoccus sp.]